MQNDHDISVREYGRVKDIALLNMMGWNDIIVKRTSVLDSEEYVVYTWYATENFQGMMVVSSSHDPANNKPDIEEVVAHAVERATNMFVNQDYSKFKNIMEVFSHPNRWLLDDVSK